MPFTNILRTGWQRTLDPVSAEDEHENLLERVYERYRTEIHQAAQFAAHA